MSSRTSRSSCPLPMKRTACFWWYLVTRCARPMRRGLATTRCWEVVVVGVRAAGYDIARMRVCVGAARGGSGGREDHTSGRSRTVCLVCAGSGVGRSGADHSGRWGDAPPADSPPHRPIVRDAQTTTHDAHTVTRTRATEPEHRADLWLPTGARARGSSPLFTPDTPARRLAMSLPPRTLDFASAMYRQPQPVAAFVLSAHGPSHLRPSSASPPAAEAASLQFAASLPQQPFWPRTAIEATLNGILAVLNSQHPPEDVDADDHPRSQLAMRHPARYAALPYSPTRVRPPLRATEWADHPEPVPVRQVHLSPSSFPLSPSRFSDYVPWVWRPEPHERHGGADQPAAAGPSGFVFKFGRTGCSDHLIKYFKFTQPVCVAVCVRSASYHYHIEATAVLSGGRNVLRVTVPDQQLPPVNGHVEVEVLLENCPPGPGFPRYAWAHIPQYGVAFAPSRQFQIQEGMCAASRGCAFLPPARAAPQPHHAPSVEQGALPPMSPPMPALPNHADDGLRFLNESPEESFDALSTPASAAAAMPVPEYDPLFNHCTECVARTTSATAIIQHMARQCAQDATPEQIGRHTRDALAAVRELTDSLMKLQLACSPAESLLSPSSPLMVGALTLGSPLHGDFDNAAMQDSLSHAGPRTP